MASVAEGSVAGDSRSFDSEQGAAVVDSGFEAEKAGFYSHFAEGFAV